MKSIVDFFFGLVICLIVGGILFFKIRMAIFLEKFRNIKFLDSLTSFNKTITFGYTPFFKMEAEREEEQKDIKTLLGLTKVINILFIIFIILAIVISSIH